MSLVIFPDIVVKSKRYQISKSKIEAANKNADEMRNEDEGDNAMIVRKKFIMESSNGHIDSKFTADSLSLVIRVMTEFHLNNSSQK